MGPEVGAPHHPDGESDVVRCVFQRVSRGAVLIGLVLDEVAKELVTGALPLEGELLYAPQGLKPVLTGEPNCQSERREDPYCSD